MTRLQLEALTRDAFAPYGRVIELPPQEAHAEGGGWRWWSEVAILDSDGRSWGIGYLDLEPAPLEFDWAECHMKTTETLIATSDDLVVYVGRADHPDEPERTPKHEQFRAFRMPRGTAIVLDPGVWHGAPFALERSTSALVLLLEGTGRDDVIIERFPENPVHIEFSKD